MFHFFLINFAYKKDRL